MLLGDLIVKPANSLVCQSRDAWFHPGVVDEEHIRNIRVNGDGFGCAFYGNHHPPAHCGSNNPNVEQQGSCVIKFVTPAWSNKNLINLGSYVYSNLIMAHVRAATNGRDPFEQCAVSIENCHPFKYGRWTFMHNGGIPRFHKVKRCILNALSDEVFQGLTGSTDSEHIFALFLNFLPDRNERCSVEDATLAIERTITKVLDVCKECGITEPSSLNLVFTDGVHIYATRYRNGDDSPPSLYYNYGKDFNCETGCFAVDDKNEACEIVVSSAPLTKSCATDGTCGNWTLMPENNLLVCVGDENDLSRISKIYLKPIDVPPAVDAFQRKRMSSLPSLVFDNSRLDLPSICQGSGSVSGMDNSFSGPASVSISTLPQAHMVSPSGGGHDAIRCRNRSTSSSGEHSVGLPLETCSIVPPITWSDDMFTKLPYTGDIIPSSTEKRKLDKCDDGDAVHASHSHSTEDVRHINGASTDNLAMSSSLCPIARRLTSTLTLCSSQVKKDICSATTLTGSTTVPSMPHNNSHSKTLIQQQTHACKGKSELLEYISSSLLSFPILISVCILVVAYTMTTTA
jgi:glutamine amidotransferase